MPLEVIESTDPLSDLVRFQTSAVYELIISLQTLLKPGHHTEWASTTRAALPPDFWHELAAVYEPFYKGATFFELAVDYPDHDDVPGFVAYVRNMDPATFIFYVAGRIVPREQIAQTGLESQALLDALSASPYGSSCFCTEVLLDQILVDVPAFQYRLADLWQWYWDEFFSSQVEDLRPHWENALNEKKSLLARAGGQGLLEHVTGKPELPLPLPPDHPVTEVVLIPLYLIPSPVYMFYGYGNVTVLFDSERTEARLTEIERSKQQALNVLKALGDSSRLDILRLIAHYEDAMHGKKIAAKLKLSASAVSRHLAQLKDAGLIIEESQDKRTFTYRLQRDVITTLPDMLLDYLHH